MNRHHLRLACLLALLVGCSVWFLAFLKTGFPGQFSPDTLIHVRGSVPTSEPFGCIVGAGALKVGLEPCGLFHFVWNHIVEAAPYLLLSLLFRQSEAPVSIFWITFVVCLVVFYLMLSTRKKGTSRSIYDPILHQN